MLRVIMIQMYDEVTVDVAGQAGDGERDDFSEGEKCYPLVKMESPLVSGQSSADSWP